MGNGRGGLNSIEQALGIFRALANQNDEGTLSGITTGQIIGPRVRAAVRDATPVVARPCFGYCSLAKDFTQAPVPKVNFFGAVGRGTTR